MVSSHGLCIVLRPQVLGVACDVAAYVFPRPSPSLCCLLPTHLPLLTDMSHCVLTAQECAVICRLLTGAPQRVLSDSEFEVMKKLEAAAGTLTPVSGTSSVKDSGQSLEALSSSPTVHSHHDLGAAAHVSAISSSSSSQSTDPQLRPPGEPSRKVSKF